MLNDFPGLTAEEKSRLTQHMQHQGGTLWAALHECKVDEDRLYGHLSETLQMPFLESFDEIRTLGAHLISREFALKHQVVPQGRLAFGVRLLTYNPWLNAAACKGEFEEAYLTLITPSMFRKLFQIAFPQLETEPYGLLECVSLMAHVPLDTVARWMDDAGGDLRNAVAELHFSGKQLAAARSMESGFQYVDPILDPPDPWALELVGVDKMVFYGAVPYALKGGLVEVLVDDPHELEVLNAFRRMTQMPVKPVVTSTNLLEQFIRSLVPDQSRGARGTTESVGAHVAGV